MIKSQRNLLNSLKKVFNNKSARLHDPLFKGNEKKYLTNCSESSFVSYVGNYVSSFENKLAKYTKSKYAVATSSGTSALHLIMKYLEVGKNDEILMPTSTYVATASSVIYCNATPNFVDIENENLGICPKKLRLYLDRISKKKGKYSYNKKTGKKIKALIVVHLYGFPSKILEIKKICRIYNIKIIEDAAEALGSFYRKKHLGTFSDAGILSFNGNKTITCGGGGAIITNDKKMAKKLKHLSVHAKKSGSDDHIHDEIGFNYRMTNLSAAVGCAQMENLKKILKAKRKNYETYEKILKENKEISILKEPKQSKTNYWLIIGLVKNNKFKKKIINYYKSKGFGFRSTWRPLHTLKIFKSCPRDKINNANIFFNKAVNFPSSPIINYEK